MDFRPAVVAAATLFLTAVTPQAIPDRISSATSGQPLWIAATAAITSGGVLRDDVLGSNASTVDRMYRRRSGSHASDAAPAAGIAQLTSDAQCSQTWSVPFGDNELGHAAPRAIAIYEGTVSEIAGGFAGQQPGTLAHIAVTRTIQASPDVDPADGLLVFHDYARFATPTHTFCVGFRPLAAGDRVLLFVMRPPADAKRQLVFDTDQIVIEHEGHLTLPSATPLRSPLRQAKTLSDVRRVVEREARHAH
jgi:hypothetical protein